MFNSSLNIYFKPMVSPYLFQSEMSNVTPELHNVEKWRRANLVKDIATQLVEFKIKIGGRVHHGELNKRLDKMSDVAPKLNKMDKYIRANLVKDIAIQLVESKMKIEEDCIMVNLINTLMMQNEFFLPSLLIWWIELCSYIGLIYLMRMMNAA